MLNKQTFATPAVGRLRALKDFGSELGSRRGVWAVVDQGTVSAGNFLLTITLARKLAPADYGIFVIVYGVLLGMQLVHSALITYPVSVLGAHKTPRELRSVGTESMLLTVILDWLMFIALAALLQKLRRFDLIVLGFSASLCTQLHETARRVLMSHLRHGAAVLGDCALYMGQVVLLWAFAWSGRLSVEVALTCIATSALAGLLIHLAFLGVAAPKLQDMSKSIRYSWVLGRWPLLTNVGYGITLQIFPWLLARRGMAAAAGFQALLNIVAIINPVCFSIGNLVIPAVAHEHSKGGAEDFGASLTRRYVLLGLAILAPYFLFLFAVPGKALRLIYGATSPYIGETVLLRFIALGALLTYVAHVLAAYFLGRKATGVVLQSQLIGSLAALATALVLIPPFGLAAAVMAFLVMSFTRVVLLLAPSVRAGVFGRVNIRPTPASTD